MNGRMDRLNGVGQVGRTAGVSSGRQVQSTDCALASDLFDKFCNSATLKQILAYHCQLCEVLNLKPTHFPHFYPKLKQYVDSWRAKALWKKFDARAGHKCYNKGKACNNARVLIIGGGPCGLRTAIDAQLLGAKVVVVEKRDRMSRNNVLHLWPFVIEDLRALGAKKFFGKFCAGAIDHISIRQIQCILIKVALLLGVEIHTEVSFEKLLHPPSKDEAQERIGWRGQFTPADHPVSQYEFDVLIGADGRRNTLDGFKRKEFRGRLAIAITANFINKRTEAEARVEEISGVAFIFNQKFFKDLYEDTGIDLENIVYYKDDTHYFVMTAKKQSLLDKGVIVEDIADTSKLLARENVNVEALKNYAREAANFSTNYQMPDLEFAVNHYGLADVTMFDFTSMYAAENASKVIERNGHRLLMILVGDSLLEPFWPTGSGCARGFLSSLDACWAIRGWCSGTMSPLEVLSERESIYRLLAQTTPENLQRGTKSYTLEPGTRYPNLNRGSLLPMQVTALFDTDDSCSVQQMLSAPVIVPNTQELHKKRRRKDTQVHPETLLHWLKKQVSQHETLVVDNLTSSFRDGFVLCAIINHYRPDLLDFQLLNKQEIAQNNQHAFDILEREYGITPVMTGLEMENCEIPDNLSMLSYLTQVYDIFRGEIPHIKHPKLDLSEINKVERPMEIRVMPLRDNNSLSYRANALQNNNAQPRVSSGRHRRHVETPAVFTGSGPERKTRKRRSADKVSASLEERTQRLQEIVVNRNERMSRRKQQRKMQTEQFIKSMTMLQANARANEGTPFDDYSLYIYRQTAANFGDRVKELENKLLYPDRDVKIPGSSGRGEKDEEFSGRIKDFEEKLQAQVPQQKKPKDLLRAIGKIETTDWNVKEIEKKIIENKMGKSVNKEKEKVPKWSREQFLARQTRLEKKGLDRQDSEDKKFATIDKTLKQLDQKLKEGNIRHHTENKVSTITEQFTKQPVTTEARLVQRSNSQKVIVPTPGGSETCHFCQKRVYLMERLSAEGRFFHRGCFRCQYCGTALRLGTYAFDREGRHGHRFYCSQHFGLQGQLKGQKIVRKNIGHNARNGNKALEKVSAVPDITVVDVFDRVQTPERIEFSNMSGGISDHEELFSQMDEDEWTDRNFGASTAELGSSDDDDDSSDSSGSESDDEAYEEAMDEPLTKEGTQRLVERWSKRYSRDRAADSDDSEDYNTGSDQSYENSSDDDDSETATEGEEEIRARELRKQEVCVEPPIVQHTDTGSDTEIASDEEDSVSSSEKENSVTEITTDSEFDHDDMTPTREIPFISLNDVNVSKHRGNYQTPKKVQVKSGELQRPVNTQKSGNIELKMTQITSTPATQKIITPDVVRPTPLIVPRKGDYNLNRTQSTGGIAAKISLELKKRYLLDTTVAGNIQKSGSTTALDTKFKSFHSNISEHQKLLNPAPEISPTMQAFLQGTSKLHQPLSPSITPKSPTFIMENKLENLINEQNKKEEQPLKSPEIIDITLKKNDKFAMQPDITKDVLIEDMKEKCDSPKVDEYELEIYKDEDSNHVCNDTEGRPRSPVHETSIIVPEISWNEVNKSEKRNETDIDTDSLSSDHSGHKSPNKVFNDIPRVEIRDSSGELLQDDDEILMDSLCIIPEKQETESNRTSIISEAPKSIQSEKKMLNQPKILPAIENGLGKTKKCHEEKNITSSGRSTPISISDDATGAVLTETELSDWARDGTVSDDLEDVEFDMKFSNSPTKKSDKSKPAKIAIGEDFEEHVCGKEKIPTDESGIPIADFDSIEFMDTGSEISDEIIQTSNSALLKNRGYVQFVHEEERKEIKVPEDVNNQVVEAVNEIFVPTDQNTGYCVFDNEDENFGGKVIDLKPSDLELNRNNCDTEDDSLLNVDAGTTTEENTYSDSTVKILINSEVENRTKKTDLVLDNLGNSLDNNEEELQTPIIEERNNDINESSEVRKSKRKSKTDSPLSTSEQIEIKEVILPEIPNSSNFTSPITSKKLDEINRERTKQKDLIHDLVMDRVKTQRRSLDKRRRIKDALSPSNSPVRTTFEISKLPTISSVFTNNSKNTSSFDSYKAETPSLTIQKSPTVIGIPEIGTDEKENKTITSTNNISYTPKDLQIRTTKGGLLRPLSVIETSSRLYQFNEPLTPKSSAPEVNQIGSLEEFKTPIAPPRSRHDEVKRTAEKLRQDAKIRARLMSDEDLGLSPEEKINIHRQKLQRSAKKNSIEDCVQDSIESLVLNTEKRNANLLNDILARRKQNENLKELHNSFSSTDISNKLNYSQSMDPRNRTKSVSEISYKLSQSVDDQLKISPSGSIVQQLQFYKSDPNLLLENKEKRPKDRERRKSIIKSVTEFFQKKKDPKDPNKSSSASHSVKDRFSRFRISPKSKEKSKEQVVEQSTRRKSLNESFTKNESPSISPTPPPIPPPPLNYIASHSRDDSGSDVESDWRKCTNSSETLDRSLTLDGTAMPGRRMSRSMRKAARQAQIKRHRQAQEIQRKLEETEVKTRELELRGVEIEKVLRGEVQTGSTDEAELLKEWFQLMQDRSELRRYERELLLRAQELEYEDRHARLQQELRERLTCDDVNKTQEDVAAEGAILSEMLEIVAKRDSLIALLEEERQRYHEEDRDFEAQILAKGLMLTPVTKTPD